MLIAPPTRNVDEFNTLVAIREYDYGIYRVFFTGLKQSQNTDRLVGQIWCGVPTDRIHWDTDLVRGKLPYIVVNVGGRSFGTYEPGATFDVRPSSGHELITVWDVQRNPRAVEAKVRACQRRLEGMIGVAMNREALPKAALLQYVEVAEDGTTVVSVPTAWPHGTYEVRKVA